MFRGSKSHNQGLLLDRMLTEPSYCCQQTATSASSSLTIRLYSKDHHHLHDGSLFFFITFVIGVFVTFILYESKQHTTNHPRRRVVVLQLFIDNGVCGVYVL